MRPSSGPATRHRAAAPRRTVRADTGLVMSPTRRVAYAVLVNWPSGAPARDEALAVMRTAGDVLRSWLRG